LAKPLQPSRKGVPLRRERVGGPKTPEAFLASATDDWKLSPEHIAALKRLLDFSLKRADRIGWGSGKTPAFSPRFLNVAHKSLYTANAEGNLWLNFAWLNEDEQELEFRQRLADQLQAIPVFAPKIKQALECDARFTIEEWGREIDTLIAAIENAISVSKKVGT
jgi:hypothetical protein